MERLGLFGSRSVAAHLLRGAIAAALLAVAVGSWSSHATVALASIGGAVVAMRGCPMCWMVGLIETIATRITG